MSSDRFVQIHALRRGPPRSGRVRSELDCIAQGVEYARDARTYLINGKQHLVRLLALGVVAPRSQIAGNMLPRRASPSAKILRNLLFAIYEIGSKLPLSEFPI